MSGTPATKVKGTHFQWIPSEAINTMTDIHYIYQS
jgi:hypothetical protein